MNDINGETQDLKYPSPSLLTNLTPEMQIISSPKYGQQSSPDNDIRYSTLMKQASIRTETHEDVEAVIPEKPVVLAAGVSVINPTLPKQAVSRTNIANKMHKSVIESYTKPFFN